MRAEDTRGLPQRLGDTGLYVAGGKLNPDVLPFSPQYPLWSDGAAKRRLIWLPPGTSIDAGAPDAWQFPPGTIIPAEDYLIVWADEDGTASPGLHASFKLSASGDEIFLTDTDANLNAVLDSIIFGDQITDLSYGRSSADADVWLIMEPTPGAANP